ncbi:MAG TPA: MFS transporter [Bacteroidales bacterium]|nr:MFS transporter [Bacteroidales bacterium]HQB22694.1 MFS transporter [Bacteroidales bacterium]
MNNKTKQKSNVVAIIMMIILFGMISFVTNLAAPMGVVLKEQFEVSNFLGLLGNMANFVAYAVMGIPGGFILQRYGYKKTALLAVGVGFVGVAVQFLAGHVGENSAFAVYLLGAFIAGFSMCLLNMVVNPMLNALGGGGNKGNQLIQLGGSFNSLMATFTPTFVGILIGATVRAQITDVFPVLYIAMGVFALVFLVLLMVSIPEPHTEKISEPMGGLLKGALKFRHFVLGAIGIFIYVGVEVGIPGTLNLWLSDATNPQGAEVGKTIAGFVVGTYWFLMLIGRLLGAALGSKISSKAMLTVASSVGLVLLLLGVFMSPEIKVSLPVIQRSDAGALSFGLANVPINAMFFVLIGLCTSIMWGGIFNLAVEGLGKYLQVASGIFMTLVCGGGIIPAIQSWVADMAGYKLSYWVIIAGFIYLLFYALVGSKNVNKEIVVK